MGTWENIPQTEEKIVVTNKFGRVLKYPKISIAQSGPKFSEETKRKMADSARKRPTISNETRIKMSKSGIGKHSAKRGPIPEERRLRQSATERRQFAEGTRKLGMQKSLNIAYGIYLLRSNWELKVAKWLDANNIIFEYESEKCRFSLPNGRTYLIDFYLPETNCYIEVKGYWNDSSKYKFFSAKEKGLDIRIIDKRNIDNISLDILEVPK